MSTRLTILAIALASLLAPEPVFTSAEQTEFIAAHNRWRNEVHWASPLSSSDGSQAEQAETPTLVVDSWGSEKHDYNHKKNSCAPGQKCGHYTQMVWRNTRQVGCGKALCPDLSQVWVYEYQPAGNWVGEKPY